MSAARQPGDEVHEKEIGWKLDFPGSAALVAFEDRAFAELEALPFPNADRLYVFEEDQAARLLAIAQKILGHPPERVLIVNAIYRFDWEARREPMKDVEAHFPSLPGWMGTQEWFGRDRTVPYLWASFEATGLQVHGKLTERDWGAWVDAFEPRVAHLERRA